MPRGEVHIQLIVDYAEDDKLSGVSKGARLLYIDSTCLAKRLLTDGVVTPQQVAKLAYPDPPAKAAKLAAELVTSGAFLEHDRGYFVSGFLKRNKSKATILAERAAAQEAADKGNHQRWHGEKPSPKCRYCIAESSPPPSGTRSGKAKRAGSPETETETETSSEPPREDIEAICQHLADRINEHVTKPVRVIDGWRTAARRLLDVDRRPIDEVFQVIDWCQADTFWQPNILSMPKLRDKYETLRLRSQQRVTQLRPVGNVVPDDEEAWL